MTPHYEDDAVTIYHDDRPTVGEALSGGLHNAGCAVLSDVKDRCDCRKGEIWRAAAKATNRGEIP